MSEPELSSLCDASLSINRTFFRGRGVVVSSLLPALGDRGRDIGFGAEDRVGCAKGAEAGVGDCFGLTFTGAFVWGAVSLVVLLWLDGVFVTGLEGGAIGRLGITVSRFGGFGVLSISNALACFLFLASSLLRWAGGVGDDGFFALGFARGGVLVFSGVAALLRGRGPRAASSSSEPGKS